MRTKNQEDEFYRELDQKTLHHSCCTTQTMLLSFIIILIVATLGTIYIYSRLKKISFSSKTILSTFQNKDDFQEKLKLEPDQENFEITITSEELTAITTEGISGKNFLVKNIQVIVEQDKLTIFGTLLKPINSQIKIEALPKVENGKIKFEVQKMTAGSLGIPKFISSKIENALNLAMDENFEILYNTAEVQTIELFDDKMVIGGKKLS